MLSQCKTVFFAGKRFHVYENVYEPAEDSFLFAENLNVKSGDVVLDMGTGCGILGIVAAEKSSKVIAVDINPHAIRCAKENAKQSKVADKIFFIQGNLFAPLRMKRVFDLILFNAPYLPTENSERLSWIEYAWSGGLDGRQVIDRFICEAPKYLKASGRVLLMQSNLSGIDETMRKFESAGMKAVVIAERDLSFFEKIVLFEATLSV
ncbi:MAG: HemK2/MTQ2 family protein methyltransferase [Candidatus Bathyarchaeales archaeon]